MKSKYLPPRLLYPARLSFKIGGEIKSFPDRQKKAKGGHHHQTILKETLKQLLKEEERKNKEEHKYVQENGNKYVPINNHFKCKWIKCSNKKT